MRKSIIFPSLVFLVGLLITWLLAVGPLGMQAENFGNGAFWRLAAVWALFPAVLAAIPTRYSLVLVGVAALLCGYFIWEASTVTSDGGMGMAIVGIVSFVVITYALVVIGIRHALFDRSRA